MKTNRWLVRGILAAGSACAIAPLALAEEAASRPGPTWGEFQRLQGEVREQRQLIIQLIQTEQQRFDMILKLMQSGPSASAAPQMPAPPSAPGETEKKSASHGVVGGGVGVVKGGEIDKRVGVLEGKVNVPGGDMSDIYVYVENVKGPAAKGKQLEIKQENKQFIPRLAVVQVGTTVAFPNLDPIFHNVFSNSPATQFDLGSYRAGDKTRSVVMTKPGVVDIYCNMHQRMSANVLVVPSKFFTKVRPDGTFRIEGVPVGARSVVAWSPSLKPASQKVEVTADGGRASFAMEYTDKKSHTNKFGQPYGSYKE